jgi:hypothetical protein
MLGVGLVLVSAGLLLMHGLDDDSGWTALLAGFLVGGVGIGLANPAIGSTAIAVVEPMRAGMASGINNTCRMGGVAVGIAALGAVFQDKVTSTLEASLPGASSGLGRAVASSGTRAVAGHGGSPAERLQATAAARHAFIAGLNEILLVGAGIVFVGACAAFLLIRARDFNVAPAPVQEPAAA